MTRHGIDTIYFDIFVVACPCPPRPGRGSEFEVSVLEVFALTRIVKVM